jgi:hypothetical protein
MIDPNVFNVAVGSSLAVVFGMAAVLTGLGASYLPGFLKWSASYLPGPLKKAVSSETTRNLTAVAVAAALGAGLYPLAKLVMETTLERAG